MTSGIGIDCRYCHVEEGAFAGIPRTKTGAGFLWLIILIVLT